MGYDKKIHNLLGQDDLKPQSSLEDENQYQIIKDPRIVDVTNPECIPTLFLVEN